jgi:uncharacterized protein (DUF488 family)
MQPTNKELRLFTVGHSNQPVEAFIDLLREHEIGVVVDVRSSPYSKYVPHFNKEEIQQALENAGIKYLFLGRELGGRPEGSEFYDEENYVLYHRLAESPLFLAGVERLEKGLRQYRVAIMCSEEDPGVCHRQLLVGRVMRQRGVQVEHIRGDGTIELAAEPAGSKQLLLFDIPEKNPWRSLRPLRKKSPPDGMDSSEETQTNDGSMSDDAP